VDLRDSIVQIKTPTMILYGAKDPVTPPAEAEFLRERIHGSAKIELEAAHLSNVEQPEDFTEAVNHFLSK
jgi:3-oxoadipate enol-lactonase